MKVTLQVELEGGIKMPISADVVTFADVKKLGGKLAALPGGANKLVPGMAEWKVSKISFAKDMSDGA